MAHIVQCRWCKEKFDTDKIDEEKWIMPAKGQYYHMDCWNEKQTPGAIRPETLGDEEDFAKWRDNICDFIKRDLKGEYNASRISKMMLEYKLKYKDWTYKGMFFALKYFMRLKTIVGLKPMVRLVYYHIYIMMARNIGEEESAAIEELLKE